MAGSRGTKHSRFMAGLAEYGYDEIADWEYVGSYKAGVEDVILNRLYPGHKLPAPIADRCLCGTNIEEQCYIRARAEPACVAVIGNECRREFVPAKTYAEAVSRAAAVIRAENRLKAAANAERRARRPPPPAPAPPAPTCAACAKPLPAVGLYCAACTYRRQWLARYAPAPSLEKKEAPAPLPPLVACKAALKAVSAVFDPERVPVGADADTWRALCTPVGASRPEQSYDLQPLGDSRPEQSYDLQPLGAPREVADADLRQWFAARGLEMDEFSDYQREIARKKAAIEMQA